MAIVLTVQLIFPPRGIRTWESKDLSISENNTLDSWGIELVFLILSFGYSKSYEQYGDKS